MHVHVYSSILGGKIYENTVCSVCSATHFLGAVNILFRTVS